MPRPFPGMDPYIESQQRFHTFHIAFIVACAEAINEHLAPPYYASVDERVLVDANGDSAGRPVAHRLGPDVAVAGTGRWPPGSPAGGVATLVPTTLPQAVVTVEQPTQKLVEIRGLPDDRLVTTVELLSPSNKKPGPDREAFLLKRADLLRHGVNLVDLDLLLAGRRVPLLVPHPPGDYFAMVTRQERADRCDVYAWSVRDPLPTVPVPLGEGVGDVPLNLAAAFDRVYRRNHFDRQLRYSGPLAGPLSDADRAWAAERVGRPVA